MVLPSSLDPKVLPISLALMVERNIREEIGCDEYVRGRPCGSCQSNGHYLCRECRHFKQPDPEDQED
jgi:hypothetical protein